MKWAIYIIILFTSKLSFAQNPMLVKLTDLNKYIRIYKNCNCGDEILNDSVSITFSKTHGKDRDTIFLRFNESKDQIKYIIDPKIYTAKSKNLSIKKNGNRTLKYGTIKYYLARKVD